MLSSNMLQFLHPLSLFAFFSAPGPLLANSDEAVALALDCCYFIFSPPPTFFPPLIIVHFFFIPPFTNTIVAPSSETEGFQQPAHCGTGGIRCDSQRVWQPLPTVTSFLLFFVLVNTIWPAS